MSVKIRLTKTGKRNQIQYRIVAQDTRTKRDGKFLEILGNFNPKANAKKVTLNKVGYDAWISKGAKPTPSLSYLLEFGKLPKKAKKVKVAVKTPDQKPLETAQAEARQPEPSAKESKAESQAREKPAESDQNDNPKDENQQEKSKT